MDAQMADFTGKTEEKVEEKEDVKVEEKTQEEEKGEAQFISATFGDGTFSDADLDQLEQVFLASTLPPLQIKSDETKEKKRPVSYPLMDVERSSTDTRNWFERLR